MKKYCLTNNQKNASMNCLSGWQKLQWLRKPGTGKGIDKQSSIQC